MIALFALWVLTEPANAERSSGFEIADLIVFLCSARNTNITGQAIRADGHFLTPLSTSNGQDA